VIVDITPWRLVREAMKSRLIDALFWRAMLPAADVEHIPPLAVTLDVALGAVPYSAPAGALGVAG